MGGEISRFVEADAQAVAELWRQAFPDDPARNEPLCMIQRKLARDPDLFWVARASVPIAAPGETADAPAGSAPQAVVGVLMAGYDGVRGWLYHLAVAPSHRRQGLATALVERAVEELQALGCIKINLQVRDTNREVRAFYEALGWGEDHSTSLGRMVGDAP